MKSPRKLHFSAQETPLSQMANPPPTCNSLSGKAPPEPPIPGEWPPPHRTVVSRATARNPLPRNDQPKSHFRPWNRPGNPAFPPRKTPLSRTAAHRPGLQSFVRKSTPEPQFPAKPWPFDGQPSIPTVAKSRPALSRNGRSLPTINPSRKPRFSAPGDAAVPNGNLPPRTVSPCPEKPSGIANPGKFRPSTGRNPADFYDGKEPPIMPPSRASAPNPGSHSQRNCQGAASGAAPERRLPPTKAYPTALPRPFAPPGAHTHHRKEEPPCP